MAQTNNSNSPSRRWIWITSAGILLILVLYSYLHQTPLKVRAVTVERGPIRSLVSTNGKVEPIQNFEAHAPIGTTLKRLLVKEGDHVHKGQLLLELDDEDIRTQAARARAQIKAAQANQSALKKGGTQEEVLTLNAQLIKARSSRDVAQRNLEAYQRLQQQGAASPGEVRQAEVTLQTAQADVNLLEQKQKDRYSPPEVASTEAQAAVAQAAYDVAVDALAKSSVRAPFDGVVYSLPVKLGAFVQTGDLLLQEADLSKILVRAFVDEPDIGRLQTGEKVEVTWDAVPGRIWTGTVNAVPSTVKPRGNRNVGETTCLIDNQDLRLLPNINVGVTIVAAEHNNVLTLQRDAMHVDDSTPYVFRIVNDRLKRQAITFSLQNLTRVEITSGLSQGDSVALPAEETKPLADGASVKVVP
ncbi:MAG TPA: efflux RND transporter periplasmic adaptor subunit [Candidatus Dormibacteraeota bacterium]|nr:efflux RND transporter periplasmic adaptor subunit [Candidatus Dormibacteraeota bacterium]